MNSLIDGYVVDVPYPSFVHRQMMPLWLSTITQLHGSDAPNTQKPFRYLELGCGMGIHLHLAAASNPAGHFVGVDFNGEHLAVAHEGLNRTQINNLEFIHTSFQNLLAHNLEPFDFIVTHGVWSWIAPEHQHAIVEIINKLLKPQGILYCSYMSHPGATHLSSIQKLMTEMARNLNGDSSHKAMQGLHLARKIGLSNQGLFAKIPSLNHELLELAQDRPAYIAHDFLSEHWQPQHAADMIRLFGKQHLAYIGGAGILENLDRITLSPDIQKLVSTLPLVTLQETVKDIARDTKQRQDIYSKDRVRLNSDQQLAIFSSIKFGLLPQTPIGQSLKNDPKLAKILDAVEYFEKILTLLSSNSMSIIELSLLLKPKLNLEQVRDLVLVLMWAGYIHPIQSVTSEYQATTNLWMLEQNLHWAAVSQFGTAIHLE